MRITDHNLQLEPEVCLSHDAEFQVLQCCACRAYRRHEHDGFWRHPFSTRWYCASCWEAGGKNNFVRDGREAPVVIPKVGLPIAQEAQ